MKQLPFLTLLLALFLASACARVYHSPEAEMAAKKHRIIAVVPPKVSIAAQKKVDPEALKEQQKTESINFQREMYSWLVRRKQQNKISVDVLDVETTNIKLQRAGYSTENPMTPAEMAEALGVDAVVTSNFALSKPMSEAGAVAVGVLFGVWGSTNNARVNLELHDKVTKKLIWTYTHEASGGVLSNPGQLVDALMRNASKKLPYMVK